MYEQQNRSNKNLAAVNTTRFYGLNRMPKGTRGELEDMKNITSAAYPCIASAPSRAIAAAFSGNIQAATAPDSSVTDSLSGFTGMADNTFYYNGTAKPASRPVSGDYTWTIDRLGELYIINGYNGEKSVTYSYDIRSGILSELGNTMDDLIVTAGNDRVGSYLEAMFYPYQAVTGHTYTDSDSNTRNNEEFFARYANSSGVFDTVNIFEKNFSVGDEMSISGFPSVAENSGQIWSYSAQSGDITVQSNVGYEYNNTVTTEANIDELDEYTITKAVVKSFSSRAYSVTGHRTYKHRIYFDLYNKNGDSLSFDETSGSSTYYCSGVKITSLTRTFSSIAVHQGKIWGAASTGNYTVASSSDEPFSFSSADIDAKYAARVPLDIPGRITGMAEYGNYLVVFKPNSTHLIYGSEAANYKAETVSDIIGCIDGRSIAHTPQGLIFLAHNGFYLYNMSVPQLISSKLNTQYVSAVSGFDGSVYYASAQKSDGTYELLAYDTRYNMWHVRDNFKADGMFWFNGSFYFAGSGGVYTETGTPGEWSLTAIKAFDGTMNNKSVSEIWVCADVAEGASFTVHTSADNDEFTAHSTFSTPGLNTYRCPVRMRMCTYYRVKISGSGSVMIYELEVRRAENSGRRIKERSGTVLPEIIETEPNYNY